MKNNERIIWLLSLIFVGFFYMNKVDQMNELELIQQGYQLQSSVKSDQVIELMHRLNDSDDVNYRNGYENGRSDAMLAALHGEHFYDYADGYHAALDQFEPSNKSQSIDELYQSLLDMLDESDSQYQALLKIMSNEN